jgi:tetratricopeptide (TPR) repeat protein
MGRKKEAAQEAMGALDLAPHDAVCHDLVAHFAFEEGKYLDAEHSWRAALAIDPTSAVRLNNFGAAIERQGRMDEARDAYRRAVRMDPSLAISKRNLHQSVRTSLGKGAVLATGGAIGAVKFGGLGILKFGVLNGVARALMLGWRDEGPALVAIIVGAAVVVWAGRHIWVERRAKRREAELEARDPDLLKLYRTIDADISAGRLRENAEERG